MISLCQLDAAFRRVKDLSPDLNIEILCSDEAQDGHAAEVAHVRSALVARVADLGKFQHTLLFLSFTDCEPFKVKQNGNHPSALDAATALVEVLVNTYLGRDGRPGRGHKHAMQAIQLLASTSQRFCVAVDLFFDLVERFCDENRGRGELQKYPAAYTDAFSTRMMQN